MATHGNVHWTDQKELDMENMIVEEKGVSILKSVYWSKTLYAGG